MLIRKVPTSIERPPRASLPAVARVVALGLGAVFASTAHADLPMVRQHVRDAVTRGAVCNDGTPAVYYVRPGTDDDADRWIVHLEGGGSGGSLERLEVRWATARHLMSSAGAAPFLFSGGIFSSDEANHFGGWTHVVVQYCSSDYYTGDGTAERPEERIDPTGPDHWEFRGKRIVRAVFEDLRSPTLPFVPILDDATEVILSGGSAGSWGAQQNADAMDDFIAEVTSDGARFSVIGDAGWEHVSRTAERDEDSFEERATALWNAQLDESCLADRPERPHPCLENFIVAEYIDAPLFMYMDMLDCNTLTSRGIDLGPVDGDDRQSVARISASIRANLEDYLARHPGTGAFVTNAGLHTALRNDLRFFELGIRQGDVPHTYHDTLVRWYTGSDGLTVVLDESPPRSLAGLCD